MKNMPHRIQINVCKNTNTRAYTYASSYAYFSQPFLCHEGLKDQYKSGRFIFDNN